MPTTPTTREILGERCGSVYCATPADRTVVWFEISTGRPYDVTFECRTHAIESATMPGLLPGAYVGAVLSGLRDIDI